MGTMLMFGRCRVVVEEDNLDDEEDAADDAEVRRRGW
jgi:hypothetical protein